MKIKFKKILPILGLLSIGVAAPIISTACTSTSVAPSPEQPGPGTGTGGEGTGGDQGSQDVSPQIIEYNLGKEEFDPKFKNNLLPNYMVLNPFSSPDAINKANEEFKQKFSLNENLQKDFDLSIVNFYNLYNNKSANPSKEIKNIKVLKVENTTDIFNTTSATVEVTYVLDNETEITQQKTIKLTPRFAEISEISYISEVISNSQNDSSASSLMDIFVGSNDDQKVSIFEQISLLSGDFNYGGLLGFNCNLSELNYTDKQQGLTDNFISSSFVPSISINKFYVPTIQEGLIKDKKIDLSIDYKKISKFTLADLSKIRKISKTEGTDELVLNDILIDPINTLDDYTTLVSVIPVSVTGNKQGYLSIILAVSDKQNQKNIGTFEIIVNSDCLKQI